MLLHIPTHIMKFGYRRANSRISQTIYIMHEQFELCPGLKADPLL